MRVLEVEIEGYRSIKTKLRIKVESTVTVILGANDHGKTNLLSALTHLDEARPFTAEDVHWDLTSKAEVYPRARFHLRLDDSDQIALKKALEAAEVEQGEDLGDLAQFIPRNITVYRDGVDAGLTVAVDCKETSEALAEILIGQFLPAIDDVGPLDEVADSVTLVELASNEFMRGIFYYAGLNPNEADALFDQPARV